MNDFLLVSELAADVSAEKIQKRMLLTEAFSSVPDEALTRLQYLQTQIGCFNSCRFCSQEAGAVIWQLSRESLADLIASLSCVARRRGIKVAECRHNHRPGILFPYLDNDVFSYPYFYEYIRYVYENLGAKTRIASVGYSRHNSQLVAMHDRIVADLIGMVAGLRFSFTPYTAGWTAESGLKLARREYEADLAFALRQYFPMMQKLGIGKETACVELRFHPHVETTEVEDRFLADHHVIKAGPHVLVRKQAGTESLPVNSVAKIQGRVPLYSREPTIYRIFTSDADASGEGWIDVALGILSGDGRIRRTAQDVPVYAFENADGMYYAVQPGFYEEGIFSALHIYPRTQKRVVSGYNDASRPFLNTLLEFKRQRGIARRSTFESATWADVFQVLDMLIAQAERIEECDSRASLHLSRHILPMVQSYIRVLETADLPPGVFFHPGFTIDTGQIVNQGRAKSLFKGLVTKDDEPLTPRESAAYGRNSVSTEKGKIWRITPVPFSGESEHLLPLAGGKNIPSAREGSIVWHQVSEMTLRPEDASTGDLLPRFEFQGVVVEKLCKVQGWSQYLQPGLKLLNR